MKHEVRLENNKVERPTFFEFSNFGENGVATRTGYVGRTGNSWKIRYARGNPQKMLDKLIGLLNKGFTFVHIGDKTPIDFAPTDTGTELYKYALWVIAKEDLPSDWEWQLPLHSSIHLIKIDSTHLIRPCPIW